MEGTVDGKAGAGAQLRVSISQNGADGVEVAHAFPFEKGVKVLIGFDAVVHVGLFFGKSGIVPGIAVFRVFHVQPHYWLKYLEGIGFETFGEQASGSKDEGGAFEIVRIQILGDDAVYHAFVDMGLHGFVSHQECPAKKLIAFFQEHLGADAGDGRGHGSSKHDFGGEGLADAGRDGDILQAEHLGQDNRVFIL